jgi:hypothetical protein
VLWIVTRSSQNKLREGNVIVLPKYINVLGTIEPTISVIILLRRRPNGLLSLSMESSGLKDITRNYKTSFIIYASNGRFSFIKVGMPFCTFSSFLILDVVTVVFVPRLRTDGVIIPIS